MLTTARAATPAAIVVLALSGISSTLEAGEIPALTESQRLHASDAMENDLFGTAVDREGDTLIIGAPQYGPEEQFGSFYVFHRDASGQWIEGERVFDPDAVPGGEFGNVLAFEGDTLIVGTTEPSGPAYVFVRNASGEWTHEQTIEAPPGAASFARRLVLRDDTAVITSTMAAHIYRRDISGAWAQETELTIGTFTNVVALDGQTLAMAGRTSDGEFRLGVFSSDGGTPATWSGPAIIEYPDVSTLSFSNDVSIDGDRMVLGLEDLLGPDRAFVYVRDASDTWIEHTVLDPTSFEGDYFGRRVVLDDELLLVSAPGSGLGGRVYVYQQGANGEWQEILNLVPSDPVFGQFFGRSLHFADGIPVVGSHHHEDGLHAGAVYVFDVIEPHLAGDLDGDGSVGFNDLLIMLAAWGPCSPPPAECPADLDGDGAVGFGDLLILLADWTG